MQYSFSEANIENIPVYTATFSEFTNDDVAEIVQPDPSFTAATNPTQPGKESMGETINIGPNSTFTTTITMKWIEEGKEN